MYNGTKIKLKRIELGISSKEFSRTINMSRYQLSAIENQRVKEPKFSTILKISKALNVTVEELI